MTSAGILLTKVGHVVKHRHGQAVDEQRRNLTRDQRIETLATLQLPDVRVPTTDGRELLPVRRTETDRDVALLLARLNLELLPQSPPRIGTAPLTPPV